MKKKLFSAAISLVLCAPFSAHATVFNVTFQNVLIDNNPNYPITGSFLYDDSQSSNPSATYGLFDFNVSAVTPYGVFDMNTLWTMDSTFTYLGSKQDRAVVQAFRQLSWNFWIGRTATATRIISK